MDERYKGRQNKGVPERDPNRYAPSRTKKEEDAPKERRPVSSRMAKGQEYRPERRKDAPVDSRSARTGGVGRDDQRRYSPARSGSVPGESERSQRKGRAVSPDEPLKGERKKPAAKPGGAPPKRAASGAGKNSAQKANKFSAKNGSKQAGKPPAKRLTQAERKAAMQKRLSWIILAVVWIAILGVAAFVLRVQSVQVVGLHRFSAQEVSDISGIEPLSQIYLADLDGAKKRIEQNPYLAVTSIARVFPDKIVITIREREERAAIFSQNLAVIIDDEGYVLSIGNRADLSNLIAVEGMQASGFSVNQRLGDETDFYANALVAILQALDAKDLAEKIHSIDISNPLRILMDTQGGVEVLVGQPVDLDDKMDKLSRILPELERLGASGGTLSLSAKGDPVYSPEAALVPAATPSPPLEQDPASSPEPEPSVSPEPPPSPSPEA